MTTHSEEELERGFARLLAAADHRVPVPCELLRPERRAGEAGAGDVWVVAPPEDDRATAGIDEEVECEPFRVVLVEEADLRCQGLPVWRAVPVFEEIEHATDEDAVLPRRAMGGRVGLAFGCEAPVPVSAFRRFVGRLSPEWTAAVLEFRRSLEHDAAVKVPRGLQTGIPATHPLDPAIRLHDTLIARMEPVMRPVLAEVFGEAPADARVPLPLTDWLREQWKRACATADRITTAGADTIADWARPLMVPLPRVAAPAGFRADDQMALGGGVGVELAVPSIDALVLLAQEDAALPDWQFQVLEDPDGALEGAQVLDPDGRVLATIHDGGGDRAFTVEQGWLLLCLGNGELAQLTRVEAEGGNEP